MKSKINMLTIICVIVFSITIIALVICEFPVLHSKIGPTFNSHNSTEATNITFKKNDLDMVTEPQTWVSVGETTDWNSCIQICVETVSASKSLPENVAMDDLIGITIATDGTLDDSNKKTTNSDGTLLSDHTYVDITVQMTCVELEKDNEFVDQPDYFEVAFADQLLRIVDSSNSTIKRSHEAAYMENLSPEYNTDYHMTVQLSPQQHVRMRLIYIIDDNSWNDLIVHFTPFAAKYDSFLMDQLNYTPVYVWLNEKRQIGL